MGIRTTCIGAYPKPDYINIANWSESESAAAADPEARGFTYVSGEAVQVSDELLDRATREAVQDQVACGIDIPTDGEQRRENYIHYHCRHFNGLDFDLLTNKIHRNGAAIADLPTVTGKIEASGEHFLDRDYEIAQSCTDHPVKITVPGPVTIIDTTANTCYKSERELAFDLAAALNVEILALAAAGCRHIQVDEPLFVRNLDYALDFGVECLERCFDGVPADVQRIMHMCCGYPGHLDDENYLKADPAIYGLLAKSLDESSIDQISIEDAHCHNDLGLLERFLNSTVILGGVAIANSRVETMEEIAARLSEALQHIDRERLVAAPDCGLMMLDRELAMSKMKNLSQAAQSV
jgi:5-methyltetrahydropteroyltriglutamate--homocysteine methyltransferase